jgi:hypothetical protein
MKEEIEFVIKNLYPIVFEDNAQLRKSLKLDSEKYDRMNDNDPNKKILLEKILKNVKKLKKSNDEIDTLFNSKNS